MNIIKSLFKHLTGQAFNLYMGGGGGGQAAPTQSTVTNTNIPEYARPYVETMLGATQQQLFNTQQNPTTGQTDITGIKPYQAFGQAGAGLGPGEMQAARAAFAGYDPLQTAAYQGVAGLQMPGQFADASNATAQGVQRAMNMGYTPGQFGNQFQSPGQYAAGRFSMQEAQAPELQNYQMQAPANVQAAQAQAAQLSQVPTAQAAQFQGPGNIGYDRAAAERVAAPQLQNLQMQAAADVGTQSFTQPGSAQQYMSPYMQNVVDVQQREAKRQSDIAALGERGQAVQRGAFGGSRQGLIEAERQRNLATQLGDIQATGQQAAFQNAQQQFNTEQQNRLQAALANQQTQQQAGVQNLSAALQTQGLGAQTGLTAQQLNQATGLQAALANQQAGLTAGQFNANMGYNTALQNAQLAQQANLANQALAGQYGLQQGQFGQAANLQNAQLAQQAALANQQAGLTTGQQNLAANLGIQQLGAGQNLQAQLANQQTNLAAQQAAEQSRQYGYGQAMTGAQLGAQYGLAGQQLGEQSRQYGAGLGLQGIQTGLQGAGQLGSLGSQQLQAQQGIYGLQNQYGAQRQAYDQNILNQAIQNYANTQQYPQQQLAFMNAMLRGLPLQTTTAQSYQAAPSAMSQLTGLGLAGAGAYGMATGRKKGGKIESRMGIDDLAMRQALEGA